MKFINRNTIKLDKEANDLDEFVFDFINILKKHTDYVIVSGYVAILLGRSRTTEDIDIFIHEFSKDAFNKFYNELLKNDYWCLNSEDVNEIFDYLSEGLPVRFALINTTIPNFEIKVAKKILDKESFKDRLTVITKLGKIYISSLERQIAFKRYYLKSDKDIEDAKHIEELFKDDIDIRKIDKYKQLLSKSQ
ncbi:MAG: nucleotidyltransferase [Nanoarchaeota archaeon]